MNSISNRPIANRLAAGLMAGVASALLVAAATPAAASPDPNPAPAALAPTAPSDDAGAAKVSHKKYCIKDQITGSRLTTMVCKTKVDWASQGVDVTAK